MGEREPLKDQSNAYYRAIFNKYDGNKDGKIELQELKHMIQTQNSYDNDIPTPVVAKIFELSDADKSGALDFDEFIDMINNPDFKTIFYKYYYGYMRCIIPRYQFEGPGRDSDRRRSVAMHYEDQCSCWPPKVGMITISLVITFCFVFDLITDDGKSKYGIGPIADVFIFSPHRKKEAWRYLTYMFVHVGYLHIIVNLAVQLLLGLPLEMVHGWWRVLVTYFAGVIAGSLATAITDPHTLLAGASGGVYSLITAQIAVIIMNWHEVTFPAIQMLIWLVITGTDVGNAIYNRYYLDTNEHIGYVAHLAGALAGLLVGINILRNLVYTTKEKYIWWGALIIYILLMFVGVILNIFNISF